MAPVVNLPAAFAHERLDAARGLRDPNPAVRRLIGPRKVMASPPTVTFSAEGGAGTITPNVAFNLRTDARFRWFGASPVAFSSWNAPDVLTLYWAFDVAVDCSAFELTVQCNASSYRFIIDGEYATADPQPMQTGSGGNAYMKIDFGARAIRHVVMEMSSGGRVGILITDPTGRIFAATTPRGKRWAALGDSLTEGASTPNAFSVQSWSVELANLFGIRDIQSSGSGGTGYLNPNSGAGRVKFRDRVQADIIARAPDVVYVFGGYNDAGTYSASAIGAEAALLYAAIKAGLPRAKLIVLGLYRPNGSPDQTALDANAAIKSAALANADLFIDLIVATSTGANTLGFMTGTGRVGALNNNGSADVYVCSDGTHPTKLGYQALARWVGASLIAGEVL